ncbi:hypothetical protein HU200_039093 [Digitaria exilis]|uniref:TF-B3 domain-containing protein n=1 Tax=Digitaria exilis TaxID=1010633 RepID=A0A835BJX3_9POAL|nr:hypothetical protein HU200_039093 [Digitaria exilis]
MKKSRKKVSTASLEKMKKRKLCDDNKKKKMKIRDDKEGKNRFSSDHKLKNMKEPTTLSEEEKNKQKMNKTHKEKMCAADSKERKIRSGHNRVQKSGELSNALFGKEKKEKMMNNTISEELQSDEDGQEEVWKYGSKVKNGKVAATFCEEDKRKKGPNNTNTEKGTAPLTPAVKEKKMRPSESKEMMFHDKPNQRNVSSNVSKEKKMDTSSGSNYKKRKREEPQSLSKKEKRGWCDDNDKKTHHGRVQEKKENKICGSRKEKNRKAPFAFFKFIYNYFEEFLLIPPAVAPNLEDLTNQHVYLEDSEKRRSKVRLSVVDGSLAFHQGWNIFVSDHLIKRGEFLLFECTARTIFSVRVFGIDSRERLCFKKDPKRVEHGVGSGPAQKDKNNETLISKQCKTKDASPLRSKERTVILISVSETSAHNEDIVNLTTSDADSRHHVTITNKDLKIVQSGVGKLPDVECGTMCIFSPTCSEIRQSSKITVTDAAPLAHENEGIMGNELEVHDLDDDLTRKQGINSIPLDSITAVEKYQYNSETNISQNFYREYAVPGGFRCLEKWSKVIVNGTVQIEPEKTRKNGSKHFDGYGSIGLNTGNEYFCSEGNHTRVLPVFTMPVEESSSADRVSKCRHGGTEIDHNIIEKGGGMLQIIIFNSCLYFQTFLY